MSQRGLLLLVLSGALGVTCTALALLPQSAPAAPTRARAPSGPPSPATSAAPNEPTNVEASPFERLPPLHIVHQGSREDLRVRLYDGSGRIDPAATAALDQLLCDARRPGHRETTVIHPRTLQLLFKAAYHFGVTEVEVVSAYRMPGRHREGPHGTGAAIDFRLRGIPARELAAYLRGIPRAGVGVYTHPKTQYVHLDSREHSFHWFDASPPGKHWRERSMGGRDLAKRDASHRPSDDLPETTGVAPHQPAEEAATKSPRRGL